MERANTARIGAGTAFSLLVAAVIVFLGVRFGAGAAGFAPFGTIFGAGNLATVVVALSVIALALSGRFGLTRQTIGLSVGSWPRVLAALVATVAVTAVVANFAGPWLQEKLGSSAVAGNRFHELAGNLPATILSVVLVAWFAAAFCEEVLFRGFALPMLERVFAPRLPGWGATGLALIVQAGLFASLHLYLGAYGAAMAFLIGLIFGFGLLAGGRSLLPVVIVHAIPDTMTLIANYQAH